MLNLLKKVIKQLIVIEGPTASGKTALSVALAKSLKTVVLSADSRQFYREMSIGTAKPTLEEQEGITHYFIDSHSVRDEVSASQYEREGLQLLEKLFLEYDQIILTGGSGMFIDALCIGLDPIPTDSDVKEALIRQFESNGIESLVNELEQVDPDIIETIDLNNPARIIRALEVYKITGKPFSSFRKQNPTPRPFQVIRFVIDLDRELLYERINDRVDVMIDEGLIEEAESLKELSHLTSLQTVGYQELFRYFNGELDLIEAIDAIKQNTRRYAKRQLTWFRRHPDAIWLKSKNKESMLEEIKRHLVTLE